MRRLERGQRPARVGCPPLPLNSVVGRRIGPQRRINTLPVREAKLLTNRPRRGQNKERSIMKIVVFGGSGLIGTRLVKYLRERVNDGIPASPRTGINAMTGE